MRIVPPARRGKGDDGVSLLLTMAFLAAFALWIGTILTLATANERGTSSVRSQRSTTYSADAAVSGAIQWIRSNTGYCSITTSPPTLNIPAYTYNNGSTSTTVTSTCNEGLGGTRYLTFIATSGAPTHSTLTAAAIVFDLDGPAGSQPVTITMWKPSN